MQLGRDYTWVISDMLVSFKSYSPVVPYSYQRNPWLRVYQKNWTIRDGCLASSLRIRAL